jgi:hypothetical protein
MSSLIGSITAMRRSAVEEGRMRRDYIDDRYIS